MQRSIFETHLAMTARGPEGAAPDFAGITHVVWPEAAMPFRPLDTPEALARIGETLPDGVHLIAGALRSEWVPSEPPMTRHYNSLIVFDAEGRAVGRYDKNHLVPFGEYLPFQRLLEGIGLEQLTRQRGGFATGPRPRPLLAVPRLPPVGALICYEAIFPGAVVEGQERPGLLLNVTNDGWFGATTGPHQHFHQARVRAVEEGIALVRVANNGISGLVDPRGRVLARLGLDARAVADVAVPAPLPATLYARIGDSGFLVLILAAIVGLVGAPRRVNMFR
jgi:apolipoprotein N-acyltransferase